MDTDLFQRDNKKIDEIIEESLDKLTDKELHALSELADGELDKLLDEELKSSTGYKSVKDNFIHAEPGPLNLKELRELITEELSKSEDGVVGKIDDEIVHDLVVTLARDLDDEEYVGISDEDVSNLDHDGSTHPSDEDLDEVDEEELSEDDIDSLDDGDSSNISSKDLNELDNEECVRLLKHEESDCVNDENSDNSDDEVLQSYVERAFRLDDIKILQKIHEGRFEKLLRGVPGDGSVCNEVSNERLAGLRFLNFDAGVEKGWQSEPCEEEFPQALLLDLVWLASLLIERLGELDRCRYDAPLPRDAGIVAQNFCEVMKQCSRLKARPELFPSPDLRSAFLHNLGKVLPSLDTLGEYLDLGKDTRDWTEEYNRNGRGIPHPDFPDGKNPWNKWLDNSADGNPGRIAIQQRIPRMGHFIMKRITLEYDAIEADFTENNFIIRDPHEEPVGIQPPGQEYSHLSEGQFVTVPHYEPGYSSDEVEILGEDGLLTLERMNKWSLLEVERREFESAQPEINFPYFQIKLSGKEEENDEIESLPLL